ncbi:hypothetical protein [Halobacteriovorax sp. CON-3]|uniref:hypothetical protein n=1 Tax=Halobacteriovorax sp. CON-3 TaxID=3157710 RepID=UPI0037234A3F
MITDNGNIQIRELVDYLCSALDLTKKEIARLIGVCESSIQKNMKEDLLSMAKKKTGKRIGVFVLVTAELRAKGFTKDAIYNGLHEPSVHNLALGRDESVVQVLQGGRDVDPMLLASLAEKGVEKYLRKVAFDETAMRDRVTSIIRESLSI